MWARVTESSEPSSSSAAVTVTVCAVPQLEVVKVRVFVELRPVSSRSEASWPDTVTVTSSEGWVDSLTV